MDRERMGQFLPVKEACDQDTPLPVTRLENRAVPPVHQ